MSITIEYFFESPKNLSEIASDLHLWLGCDLKSYDNEPKDLYCRLLGMEFTFSTHDLDDDRDLVFSRYPYYVSIRTPALETDFRPLQLTTMLSVVYALYRRLKIVGMLVFDLQILLAIYEERITEEGQKKLFDTISTQWVVFPQYFAKIASKVPAGAIQGEWERSIDQYLKER